MSKNENWVLGVALGLLGSIAINSGNNLQCLGLKYLKSQETVEQEVPAVERQKKSSLPSLPWLERQTAARFGPRGAKTFPLDESEETEFVVVKVGRKSQWQSVTYNIGTFIFVAGSLLNFASFAYAAQSMLASLESIQFVTNLLFGKFLLGAHVTQTMLAGTVLTVTGTVLAVQFSSKETLALDISAMKQLYSNPAYLSYLLVMGILLVALDISYRILNERKRVNREVKHSDIIQPCIYSFWSALIGTQSVVHAKLLAELLVVHTSGDENIFRSWFTYVTILVWILTVIVWLKRLNDALKIFDPLFIIPLLQCSFIFLAIVSGGIYFREFDSFDTNQWLGFWFGIFVMFSGLVLLTPKPKGAKDDELHQALVNLLLESGSSLDKSAARTPHSPKPTPRQGNEQTSSFPDDINSIPANEGIECDNRYQRSSMENNIASAALDAVKDAFNGDPRAKTLSEAMLMHTTDQRARKRRRTALKKLLGLIKDNPITSEGYNEEIANLIRELQLVDMMETPVPGPDIRDMAKHLLLEIERNKTSKVI
ncbi:hypothetical protein ACHAXH_007237 [Discostella pseudostelligera]